MAPYDFAIKETTQVPSEGILLQIVKFTNIIVIIVSHLFLNNEICLQSCLPFDLFKLVDVKGKCKATRCSLCYHAFTVPGQYIGAILCRWKSFQIPSIESRGNLCSRDQRNTKRISKGAHIRALCRGPAKTPSPHRGLYSNCHQASCRHL